MSVEFKTSFVLIILTAVFLGLTEAFRLDLWGHPERVVEIAPVDPAFTNTATVRVSAAELIRTGGDTSGLDCYACHDKKKPVQVKIDDNKEIVLPDEHKELVIMHGRNKRNVHCFNCHDPASLDLLQTRDGQRFKFEESTRLCAACHGPTYRDWEVGIHGRGSGFWDRQKGAITKQGCTSCHDPHAPAFPPIKPAPGPHLLHPLPEPHRVAPIKH